MTEAAAELAAPVGSAPARAPLSRAAGQLFAPTSPFAALDEGCLAALKRIAVRRTFTAGQAIYVQDDEARFLNVVAAGHVRLSYIMEDGSAVLHDVLPQGEAFGELGVFDRSGYCDMASAVGLVALASLPVQGLSEVAADHPQLVQALSRSVAIRYRSYIALTRDLSLRSLSGRLAQAILRLAERLDVQVVHGGQRAHLIGSLVTQTDLGLMARGSRGNVNRTLQAWQRAGWIVLQERSILVLDRAALQALSADDKE